MDFQKRFFMGCNSTCTIVEVQNYSSTWKTLHRGYNNPESSWALQTNNSLPEKQSNKGLRDMLFRCNSYLKYKFKYLTYTFITNYILFFRMLLCQSANQELNFLHIFVQHK